MKMPKKLILLSSTLILIIGLASCTPKKETSSDKKEIKQETKKEKKGTKKDSRKEKEAKKPKENSDTANIVNEKTEVSPEEEQTKAFDALPKQLQVLLAISTQDERAETPGLQGYTLGYNEDQGFLFAQIHSGAGTGHPVYQFTFDEQNVNPVASVTRSGFSDYAKVDVSGPVSKASLYQKYLANKETYDSDLPKIILANHLTLADFDEQMAKAI